MDIDKRNRTELKAYFVKNAIPTESNFAELIDGMLNQKDDGIVKPAGNPLSIEASGDATSQKKAINFYDSLADANPSWVVSLNPRSKPGDPQTARTGFCITDGDGNNRLFVDRASGNVGIGTIEPSAKLEVNGRVLVRDGVIQRGGPAITDTKDLGLYSRVERNFIRVTSNKAPIRFYTDGGKGTNYRLSIEANGNLLVSGGRVGIGTAAPSAKLHVSGAARVQGDLTVDNACSTPAVASAAIRRASSSRPRLSYVLAR